MMVTDRAFGGLLKPGLPSIQRLQNRLQPRPQQRKQIQVNAFQLFQKADPSNQTRSKAREEFLQCIAAGDRSQTKRISELLQILLANPPPFKESMLGGGPWQVVYTQGAFLWQLYTSPGQILTRSKNRASQAFDPTTRDVLNSGDIFGPNIQVSAVGSYTPVDESSSKLPKEVDVTITGGELDAWGRKIALPIKGNGKFFIEYVDDTLRVFRSPGGNLSVQMRKDKLEKLTK